MNYRPPTPFLSGIITGLNITLISILGLGLIVFFCSCSSLPNSDPDLEPYPVRDFVDPVTEQPWTPGAGGAPEPPLPYYTDPTNTPGWDIGPNGERLTIPSPRAEAPTPLYVPVCRHCRGATHLPSCFRVAPYPDGFDGVDCSNRVLVIVEDP